VFSFKPLVLQIGLIRQPRFVEKSGLNDIHLLTMLIENQLRAKTIPIKRRKCRLPAPHAALAGVIAAVDPREHREKRSNCHRSS
jgi:hypothetical protein